MKIVHTGTDFENPKQKRVDLTYLVGFNNKTIVISINSAKGGFAKNRSNKPFVFPSNFHV